MKVYIYYLTVPEKPSEKFTPEKLSGFNVVIKMFSDSHFMKIPGVVIDVNNVQRYLYAFTRSKKLAADFESVHNMTLFTKIEKKMDKEEYEEFKKDMDHAYLEYHSFDDKSNILITKLEGSILDSAVDDIELYLCYYAALGYEAFKDKYIRALDILLYTLYYQMNGQDAEFYGYNYAYGLTPEGVPGNQVMFTLNFMNTYLGIFGLILK